MEEKEIKVVLMAKNIPLGTMVTKKTGEKVYELNNKMTIYHSKVGGQECKTPTVVSCEPGTVFLLSQGSINSIPDTVELCWHTTYRDMYAFLENKLDEDYR